MHLTHPLVIFKKPIIIPPRVIGKEQYPNRHIIWQIPICAPKNCPLNVTINPPIQNIVNIITKVELSLLSFERDIQSKKQNIKGPHKSQLYNSSIFLEVNLGVITCFNLL